MKYILYISFLLFLYSCSNEEINNNEIFSNNIPSTLDLVKYKVDDNYIIIGSGEWKYIAYSNNKYIAVSKMGYVSYSNDGIEWTLPNKSINNHYNFNGIVYKDNISIAIDNTGNIYISDNETEWSINKIGSYNWKSIIYGNDKFVIVGRDGYIATSSNGKQWDVQEKKLSNFDYNKDGLPDPYGFNGISYGNGIYIATAGIYTASSSDGVNWEIMSSIDDKYRLSGITFINGTFIAIANTADARYGYITKSTNLGHTWEDPTQILTTTINCICAIIQ